MAHQVPDYSADVRKLYGSGCFDLRLAHEQEAFTDACVSMLNGKDEAWGHLIKKPGQTSVHDHGEDSALYLFDDGTAKAVDFIGGAGGPNPQPGWIVDNVTPYKEVDWFSPTDHGIYESAPPAPVYPPYPGDQIFDEIGVVLFADYAQAGNAPDPQMGRWFGRTIYDWLAKVVPTLDASIQKHRAEWRAILGLPPL